MIIDILGLGESISLYRTNNNITFGVNDIYRKIDVDYLVCVDDKKKFTEDRLKYIENNKAKAFYSQLDCWEYLPNYQKIELQNRYPDYECDLLSNAIPKSVYSPFIAICLAYKIFKPSIINLYGVDMINHPHLSNSMTINRILRHTLNLKVSLNSYCCELIVHGNGILKNLNCYSI